MKRSIQISAIVFFICLCLFGMQQKTIAQKADVYKAVSDKIEKKDFVFVAQSLTPLSGPLRVLTSTYDVRVTADSVISYLPYFGKAQQVPSTSEDAGIIFTSTKFDYVSETGKKKSWDVTIKFKDQRNTSTFSFIIYDNGEASLNVTSMLRDPISFRGHIKL
ncbi:MAG: DUF4251 domain-containing protein [Ferruginibacter sp.]